MPVRLSPVAVTVLPVPTFLLSNVAVPPVRLTLSVPITPARERPVIVADVVASYALSEAVMLGATDFAATASEFEPEESA